MVAEGKSIREVVDQVVQDGHLTVGERAYLEAVLFQDGRLDEEEHEQLRRLMDLLADGALVSVGRTGGDAQEGAVADELRSPEAVVEALRRLEEEERRGA